MKLTRTLVFVLGAIGAGGIVLLLVSGGRARDNPLPDAVTKAAVSEPRNEVAYPPPYPSYSPVAAVAAVGKNGVDLCGYGRVDPELLPAGMENEAEAAILRAADDLGSSADDGARAVGLATQAWIAAQTADRLMRDEDPIVCRELPFCEERAAAASRRAATPPIEALTRLAMATRDPQAYVIAMRACRSIVLESPPEVCAALSVEQWAQLDPDNALPWLFIARKAHYRKDTVAFEEALLRASRGQVFDRRATHYSAVLEAADVRHEPARTLVVGKLAMAEARDDPADYFSNFTIFFYYCSKPGDPSRRDLCGRLVRLMTDNSPDRLGLQIGTAMDFGPPDQHVRKVRPGDIGVDFEVRLARANAEELTCAASAQTEQYLRGVTRHGELDYLRQLAASRKKAR